MQLLEELIITACGRADRMFCPTADRSQGVITSDTARAGDTTWKWCPWGLLCH